MIKAALAASRPTVTGKMPACATARHGLSLKRSHRRITTMTTSEDGTNLAKLLTSMPGSPAICQPIMGTIIRFGPGAAWASANSAVKFSAVIQ
ncbi:hypothetical protein BOSP111201_26655 [Bordetella sputigena]